MKNVLTAVDNLNQNQATPVSSATPPFPFDTSFNQILLPPKWQNPTPAHLIEICEKIVKDIF